MNEYQFRTYLQLASKNQHDQCTIILSLKQDLMELKHCVGVQGNVDLVNFCRLRRKISKWQFYCIMHACLSRGPYSYYCCTEG